MTGVCASVVPETLRPILGKNQALLLELFKHTRLRPSVVIVPWAVVLLDNPSISTARLAELISFDPVLASRALGLANQPHTSMQGLTTNIDEALMRLGLVQARGFVLASTLPFLHLQDADSNDRESEEAIWRNSLQRAVVSREITKALRFASADDVYACSLVTSGILQMEQHLSRSLKDRLEKVKLPLEVLLSVSLGIVEGWPLEWIQVAVELTLEPQQPPSTTLGQTLSLAQKVSPLIAEEGAIQLSEHPEVEASAQLLALSEASLQKIISSARKTVRGCFKQFGVSLPTH